MTKIFNIHEHDYSFAACSKDKSGVFGEFHYNKRTVQAYDLFNQITDT